MLNAGSLVSDAECMSPAMKDSLWYVKSGLEPVKVNMEKEDVIQKEPFKLSANDYSNILGEISRRESIDFDLGSSDEFHTAEI
eukprot:11838559-Ditylum_brightwellii.AAC.1